jgi:uncharacterized protein (TIGR02444 family)
MPAEPGRGGSFWDFSLAFYSAPGVAEACLELQDRNGADVNVVLFLLHLARARRLLAPADVARIDALARPWREAVVAPLRRLRRALKAAVGAFEPAATARLRGDVKRIELAAERLQQETLERLAPAGMPAGAGMDPAACARAHLAAYGEAIGGLDAAAAGCILELFERWCAASGRGDGGRDTIGHTQ